MSAANICTTCGLPKELCVCETLTKEEDRILVHIEKKRFGKITTLVEGIEAKEQLKTIAKELKSKLACGGTITDSGAIELQGDHRRVISDALVKLGFKKDNIEVLKE